MDCEKFSRLLQSENLGEFADSLFKTDDCQSKEEDASKNSPKPRMETSRLKGKCKQTQTLSEMTDQQLEQYKHSPETELADLVCSACKTDNSSELKDYLEVVIAVDPSVINETDSAGMTALHFAVSCKHLHVVSMLMKYGADIRIPDGLGFTPLFLTTGRYPCEKVTEFLLKSCEVSDVNHQTKTGATPLHGAALQGNLGCIKLLLEHGADPKLEDEDGTTALELAKDSATKAVLHMYLIQSDIKRDTVDAVCVQCKQIPKEGLKRCGACHVTMYCGKACQVRHWREGGHKRNCPGSVIARPFRVGEDPSQNCVQVSFYRVMGSNKPNVKVFKRTAKDAIQKMKFIEKKRFVVKVQLPLNAVGNSEMMVYNADRTVEGYVYPNEPGYLNLQKKIQVDGYRGIKAFFWAELTDKNDGTFRIFGGKCAPYQTW
ncbi:ankyrin repeat family A protein 2-like [Saccostrea cucullata]|uniref:ankyrin repeat family A protein 2-like n=1 Tax=Saccostrea cuccullata TaxID=36930 RepID=UPI002ED51CF8